MKRVMVFGTFDMLHPGHLDFFRQARRQGNLIIVVARDQNVLRFKKQSPVHSEQARIAALQKLNVGEVMLGHPTDLFHVVRAKQPDIICFGYDQEVPAALLQQITHAGIPVIRLQAFHPEMYKSSLLRQKKKKRIA